MRMQGQAIFLIERERERGGGKWGLCYRVQGSRWRVLGKGIIGTSGRGRTDWRILAATETKTTRETMMERSI